MDRALMLGLGLQDTAPGKALDGQIPCATLSTTRGAHPRKQKHKEDQVKMSQIHVSDLILTLTHSFSFSLFPPSACSLICIHHVHVSCASTVS